VAALAIVIIGMLFMWQPWANTGDRTIEVTGQTKVKAVPDQFVFYPAYQFKGNDKNTALTELTKKSDDATAKLKELGVVENNIKTDSSGFNYPLYIEGEDKETTYSLQLTVTVDNAELAQKVQDFLVTTEPTGSVSPQPGFSETKRKELEATARDQATKEARAQADQMAKNLGFRVSGVKSVTDSAAGGGVIPYMSREGATATDKAQSSFTIHPGENELPYSVTVVYFIR
jgi:uncharacterized protein YggE